jgi:diguanylate cyclase (GGDEF)-like protein
MQPPRIPDDEAARLLELRSYSVLDTDQDPRFDDISELTRYIAGTEIGIVSLVDSNRQWFKSCVGAPLGQQQTARDISFCGHTILQRQPLIINDALEDERFADNPLVLGSPHVRFYAGFPLITPNGFTVGSLCAISRQPHQLNHQQIDALGRMALLTVQQLEYLRNSAFLSASESGLEVERLRGLASERMTSLERLINRDQLVRMMDLMFGMELGSSFSLLRCSFRDYERVNSNLGGLLAEEYMNEAARRVLAAIPRSASVARFADAEFVVLLPFSAAESDAQKVAERILAFANHVYRCGNETLSMALSIGVAIHHHNYDNAEAILADTSIAVRMARRSSASAVRFIDAESRVAARENYRLESEIREAVAEKVMEPFLQPIVNLTTGEPIGFEALARWPRHGGIAVPGVFLPLATECGITGDLDLLIIEKTLAAMPLLARPVPQRPMLISMNLSGLLLEDEELRRRLLALIDDNPCPPGWQLQLELVEDVFRDSSSNFSLFLEALASREVRIAIDDFGTGYSSLARLISLPIQAVKVDRAFVAKLDGGEGSPQTLLRTMFTMLADLGLEITAEGVETQEQREWLLANGAHKAQGYLFAQPMSLSDAIAYLQNLNYRPRAIPVEPARIQALRRRRLRSVFRLPFQGGRRSSD